MNPAIPATMSMMSFALSSCQRPTPLVNVVLSVPKPYSTPTTDAASIMMGMTRKWRDIGSKVMMDGRVKSLRPSSATSSTR